MMLIRPILKYWLALAAAVTLVLGVVYVGVQQSYRTGANDPQIQLAEDAARALAAGTPSAQLVSGAAVDVAHSLAPYLIVYDAAGRPLAASAQLHDAIPEVPQGVLDYAREHGENRLTWQPEPGVRSAIVVAPVAGGTGGYVLAGRSLREVERREADLRLMVGLGWAAALAVSLALLALFGRLVATPQPARA